MEMYSSMGLSNKNQGFIGKLKEAHWNQDSLVVSGNKGCFLLELKKIEYNDEMIKIDCSNIKSKISTGVITSYFNQKQ